ncbi:MAG: hypothetical protein R3B68_04960 [Phycisphaerales bacterium]
MSEIEIMNVPVYAEPYEVFEARVEKRLSDDGPSVHTTQYRAMVARESIVEAMGGHWRYNRAAGWLRLIAVTGELQIDLYRNRASPLRTPARLHYQLIRWRADSWNSLHGTSRVLARAVVLSMRASVEHYFKKCWTDWDSVARNLECTDLRRLMDLSMIAEGVEREPRREHQSRHRRL